MSSFSTESFVKTFEHLCAQIIPFTMTNEVPGAAGAAVDEKPHVYAIVPVYNRILFTRRCLDCFRAQTYRPLTVIVVDDGSTDETPEVLRTEYPEVVTLRGTGDLWWSGATNLGMQWALDRARDSDYILLMNNDLTFDPGLVETLVRVQQLHPKSVIASIQVSAGDCSRILCGARRVNWWTGRQRKLHVGANRDSIPPGHIEPGDYVTGEGVLYPVYCLRDIGTVSRRVHHTADFELGVRAAKHGYSLLYAYDAVVYHQREDHRGINVGPYRVKDIYQYYFDRRSYAYLHNIFWNSILCTKNPIQAASYFLNSILRTGGHFLKNLAFSRRHQTRSFPT